jgi:hypothetical protein
MAEPITIRGTGAFLSPMVGGLKPQLRKAESGATDGIGVRPLSAWVLLHYAVPELERYRGFGRRHRA